MDDDKYWHHWDECVDKYCDALEQSRLAEQMLKANYAARFKAYKGSMGVEEAKQSVQNDRDYLEAHGEAVHAEVEKERAKLALEKIRMRFSEWQTRSANRRRV